MSHAALKLLIVACLFLAGCAGWERGCSSCVAEEFGADWVVVELTEAEGVPYRCWELKGASVANEINSDGIYWQDRTSGNLVHISGSYDYVQVIDGHWDDAFAQLNITRKTCKYIRNRRLDRKTMTYMPK